MMVVVPHLSENLELFGIYSVCLSISVYLSYSDLGFISAGQKFAAEAYKRNESLNELAITGFSIFILILMFLPFSILSIFLASNPELLLNKLSLTNRDIASNLLLIVAILLPVQIVLERATTFILSIRLKDFIGLRVTILVNILKISSVFVFFSEDEYMLTQYYLFVTLISIVGSIITLLIIKFKLNYDLLLLISNIKYRKDVFTKIGKLALSSFVLTISFVIHFQIDSILIASFIGIEEVAIFAVGFTLMTFLKSIINIVYSPFAHSLNHQAASSEDYGLTIQKILAFTFPAYLIGILVITLSAQYLVTFWVGVEYQHSIRITEILFVSIFFQWLNTPAAFFYSTALKYRYHYILAALIPILFIVFLVMTHEYLGVEAFAWAKIFIGGVSSIFACFALRSIIDMREIVIEPLLPLVAVLLSIAFFLPSYLQDFFPAVGKSSQDLLLLLAIASIIISVSYLVVVLMTSNKRKLLLDLCR